MPCFFCIWINAGFSGINGKKQRFYKHDFDIQLLQAL